MPLPCLVIRQQHGNALRNYAPKQDLGVEPNSNDFNSIFDGAYSLLRIIRLGPSHTSEIRDNDELPIILKL